MRHPGERLRALAARVFDARAMERLIDPVIADLQAEYGAAARAGRTWTSLWVRLAGYAALLKIVVVCGWREAMVAKHEWTANDRRGLVRVIGFSVAPVMGITVLLELTPLMQSLNSRSVDAGVVLTLIPQALAIAVPVGAMLGILFGLHDGVLSRRLSSAIVVLSVICSAASFANLAWMVPSANHSFRLLVADRLGANPQTVQKGPNELTLDELGRRIQSLRSGVTAAPRDVHQLEGSYYSRWALAFAPLVLALLALSIVSRRSVGRPMLSVAACVACFGYYVLLYLARALAVSGEMPSVLVAWLPNVTVALVATLMTMTSTRSAELAR